MQKKNGISLIVLVITIIVMVILAGAIILTLNNSGIIGKASEAVEETNLATVKEVASLAWAEAYTDGARTQADLEKAVLDALEEADINTTKYAITVTTSGVTVEKKIENEGEVTTPVLDPALNHSGIIPEGGRYVTGATVGVPENDMGYNTADHYVYTNKTELTAGQSFPIEVKDGDQYYYGKYIYVYNATEGNGLVPGGTYFKAQTTNGWHVSARGDSAVTDFGSVLESINSQPITDMNYTFYYCLSLEVLPKIPATVTSILGLCYMDPSTQSGSPKTYEGSTDPEGDFSNYIIPEGVINMENAFYRTPITKAPTVPSTVTKMARAFAECGLLTGSIVINANPTSYSSCLYSTQITEITGSTTLKTELLATKTESPY